MNGVAMDEMERYLCYFSLTEVQKEQVVEAVARDSKEFIEQLDVPITPGSPVYQLYIRRIIDIIVSGLALFLTAPINLLLAIGTYVDVGRPIFFKQERVGKNGRIFTLVKFRNMTNETDENGVLLPPEKRITRFGKFVRKASLDELLNFLCIFKGDMTLIGPRPLPVKYYTRYSKVHRQRHLVKPGLECPFHIEELAELGWMGRFENDLWYVENISFKTDVYMMWRLLRKVFSKKERVISASGQEREFIGYDSEGNIIHSNNLPERYLYSVIGEKRGTIAAMDIALREKAPAEAGMMLVSNL